MNHWRPMRRRALARLVPASRLPVSAATRRSIVLARIGNAADRLLRSVGVVRSPAGSSTEDADRVRGAALLVASVTASVWLPLGGAIGVIGWHLPHLVEVRSDRRRLRALEDDVVLAVELFAVSAHTGSSVSQALIAVTPHVPGKLGIALRGVGGATTAGVRLDEALAQVAAELGDPVSSLVAILRAAHLDGDPLGPALTRLGDQLHAEQRNRSEVEARRLSVRLVLPLVCCILPGFVLVGIAPVVVDALRHAAR